MRSLERQQARHRVYSMVALGGILVMGVVSIVMMFSATRKKAQAIYKDPVLALRDIFARQETLYFMHHRRYATLDELVKDGSVSGEVLGGPVQGYLYKAPVVANDRFVVSADPVGPFPPPPPGAREVPKRYYAVDETHTIRADAGPVTSASPVIWSPRDAGPR